MSIATNRLGPVYINLQSDETLDALYEWLIPMVRKWVYRATVTFGKGQESDIVEDTMQATLQKVFHYIQEAQQQGIVITSLEQLSTNIARAHLLDQQRRNSRLLRIEHNDASPENENVIFYGENDPVGDMLDGSMRSGPFAKSRKVLFSFRGKYVSLLTLPYAWRHRVTLRPPVLSHQASLKKFIGWLPVEPVAYRHSSLAILR